MNLLEPLTAGVIFFIALLASVQIDAYITKFSEDPNRSQQFSSAAHADAAMLISQEVPSSLSQPLTSPFPIADCSSAAIALAQKINEASVPSDVTRSATVLGSLVVVEVEASNLAPRQRTLSPAAYGLCSS
jgi:hypothetical protein